MTTSVKNSAILPPPTERSTLLGWMRKNLFGSWLDTILTFVALAISAGILVPAIRWGFSDEARWEVIPSNIELLMFGSFPRDQVWRLWLCLWILALLVGLLWGVYVKGRSSVGFFLIALPILGMLVTLGSSVWVNYVAMLVAGLAGYMLARWRPKLLARPAFILTMLYFPIVILLIRGVGGDTSILPGIGTNLWGGLMLSLLISVVGIVFSFPIGVLLALGRQSELPAARLLSILYIEVIRGVPLITLLFLGQVMLNFFLPSGMTVDRVIRAMVAVVMFAAAYLAENVRGGLQSIPNGQYEAADAVGLSGFDKMIHIILPQALRAVIPVLVGQFIGLFKDTTLVALVGLLDLLGIARSVLAQPNFIGTQLEIYIFVAFVYWIFSYAMSYASKRLEESGVGMQN